MPHAKAGSPVLLVKSGGDAAVPAWQSAFAAVLPELDVRGWNDPDVDPAMVRYVLVWEPEAGRLAQYPNLEIIFSTAAGVDHIIRDPHRPLHLPIIRMGADDMAQTVGEYACLGALAILRDLPRILADERRQNFERFEGTRTARTTRAGIMGMGKIGQATARMLQGIGFQVQGWTRTPRSGEGVRCYSGPGELDSFLANTDILVGILPDTPETRWLLNADRLAKLPRGAGVVNVGRGTLIVMADLLAALDSGHISTAVLDVFEPEPLPPGDPAWSHERILVSGHVAGYVSREGRAEWVAQCLAQHRAGLPMGNVYDPDRGY
jgi:glyoxylate/hydroxypyruvate reductase A